MNILDTLIRLHAYGGHPATGQPPDFVTIPWDRVQELEREMDAICNVQEGPQSPYSFLGRMIRGEVTVNGRPVHPGVAFGVGYRLTVEPAEGQG